MNNSINIMIAIVTVRPVLWVAGFRAFKAILASWQDTPDKSNKLDATIDKEFIFFLF